MQATRSFNIWQSDYLDINEGDELVILRYFNLEGGIAFGVNLTSGFTGVFDLSILLPSEPATHIRLLNFISDDTEDTALLAAIKFLFQRGQVYIPPVHNILPSTGHIYDRDFRAGDIHIGDVSKDLIQDLSPCDSSSQTTLYLVSGTYEFKAEAQSVLLEITDSNCIVMSE